MGVNDRKDDKRRATDSNAQPVAPKKLKPIDVEMLKRLVEKMPFQSKSAGDFIRRMRDSDRY